MTLVQRNIRLLTPFGNTNTPGLTAVPASITATFTSGDINVGDLTELAVDVSTTVVTGTTPTLDIFVDRKGTDGVYYNIYHPTQVTTVTTSSGTLGVGAGTNVSLGSLIRLRLVVGGTTPSFTLTVSLIGK